MPIIDAYKARTVMVIKRSMGVGFAGIDNDLYYRPNTLMLFGDAKAFTTSLGKRISRHLAGPILARPPLDLLNHKNLHGRFGGFQFEPELIRQRREKGREGVRRQVRLT